MFFSRSLVVLVLCGLLFGTMMIQARDTAKPQSAPSPNALPRCTITKEELRKGCEEYYPYGFVSSSSTGSIVLASSVSLIVGLLLGGLLVHCWYRRRYGSVYTGYIEIGS